jgi:hypothetical protein
VHFWFYRRNILRCTDLWTSKVCSLLAVRHTRTHTHTQPVARIWNSDQSVVEAATYTTHYKHKRRTSMFSAGFEPAIPATERLQTYALDRMVTRYGTRSESKVSIFVFFHPGYLSKCNPTQNVTQHMYFLAVLHLFHVVLDIMSPALN